MKKKHSIKIMRPKSYFEFGLIVLAIKTLFSFSAILTLPDLLEKIFTVLASILMFISIFRKKYGFRTLIIYFCIIVIPMYTSFMVGDFAIFVTVITVLAIRGKDFDKELEFLFQWEMLFIVIQLIAFFISIPLGVSPFTMVGRNRCVNFGFSHPNVMGVIISNMFCLWLWNNFEKLKLKKLMIITAVEILTYVLTGCRTALYLYIVILLLIGLSKVSKKIINAYSVAVATIIPILSIAIYYAISNWNTSFSMLLNVIFSGRVLLGAYALDNVGLTFLGQNINALYDVKWNEIWRLNSFTFDNLYTMIMMKYGIVWLILFAVVFWKLAKKNSLKIDIMLIGFALYGITEVHGLNCYIFFPLLLTSILMENNRNGHKFVEKIP